MKKGLFLAAFFIVVALSCYIAFKTLHSESVHAPSQDLRNPAFHQDADSLASRFGLFRAFRTGRSVQGRPIQAYCNEGSGRPVLLIAEIHGDEPGTHAILEQFMREFRESKPRIIVVPTANPDGIVAGTRTNANGVDINRNWPTRDSGANDRGARYHGGDHAMSEPETRFLFDLISSETPSLVISFHEPLNCVNYDGPAAEHARQYAEIAGLPVKADIGYPTPGSLGTYLGKERDIPILTVELLSQQTSTSLRNNVRALTSMAIRERR